MQNFSGWIAEEWTAREKVARRRSTAVGGFVGGAAALAGVLALWGFCVDDAWIIARVAENLSAGRGHRFNADGPVVDAVTPFGYAHLVALLNGRGVLGAFRAARALGAASFVLSGVLLGARVGSAGVKAPRFIALLLLAFSVGLPAWAVAGMETAVVVLVVVAGSGMRVGQSALLGLAAAWRPELLPFALVFAVGAGWAGGSGIRGALARVAVCLLPTMVMVGLRVHFFGVSYPLAFVAKPSDLLHGLRYSLGGAVFTGVLPLLLVSPRWGDLSGAGRTRLLAVVAHGLALCLAGGDWMPLYRLWCPAVPAAVLVAAEAFEKATMRRVLLSVAATSLCVCVPAVAHLSDARAVEARRLQLVRSAAPLLEGAKVVAALDVGWVGMATTGRVVDLAGVTDPEVAYLPGGHTSKRIPRDFSRRKQLDAAIVLVQHAAPSTRGKRADPALGSRAVEKRLLRQLDALGFRIVGSIPLGGTKTSYLVMRQDAGHK